MKVPLMLFVAFIWALQCNAQKTITIETSDSNRTNYIAVPVTNTLQLKTGADPNMIHWTCDVMPMFRGGPQKLEHFIEKHLRWPEIDKDTYVQGKVFLQFVVEKNGKLSNFIVLRTPAPEFGVEAIRVMKKSPKWIPGKIENKAVRCYYTLPVKFALED